MKAKRARGMDQVVELPSKLKVLSSNSVSPEKKKNCHTVYNVSSTVKEMVIESKTNYYFRNLEKRI
jgi:hypothetical protein